MSSKHLPKQPKDSKPVYLYMEINMLYLIFSCTNVLELDPSLALPDTNTTSATFDEYLSLNDYEGTVSAWYFGHAT